MAPHSSTLAWKIPWMEEPGRLQSMESLKVGHKIHVHTIYVHIYKSFSTTLDKGLRKNIKKRRDGEIGKHKLNEMGAPNMK